MMMLLMGVRYGSRYILQCGLLRWEGLKLFVDGSGAFCTPPGHLSAAVQRRVVSGSKTFTFQSVKCWPSRMFNGGVDQTNGKGTTSRQPSKLVKMKSLSFRMGPPTTPPNWCWLCLPRGLPAALFWKVLASRLLVRKYSNTSPCQELPPALMVVLTVPPPVLPNWAS